ncbi:acyl-CoA dehydrogenase family protein [Sodalis sp. RH16]|uniref:acyl-CoA dehydrogenase family protein n=1 Tax=Sodalis sp. RH16 TaxID=3394331 RepID=UPI0039B5E6C0
MNLPAPMSEPHSFAQALPTELDKILEPLPAIMAEIAKDAARRERERILPHSAFALLRATRLGSLRIPAALGGAGASIRQTLAVVSQLAAADSNVAHAMRSHFNAVETLLLSPAGRLDRYIASILTGELLGGAHTERGSTRPGEVRTRLTRRDGGYRLNGQKYYATGAAFADRIFISAVDEEGRPASVEIQPNRKGVRIADDWDAVGQRLTSSGSIVLEDVQVSADEVEWRDTLEPEDEAGRHAATFRQLYLAACQAGIVRNVLSDAIEFVKKTARTITHGHTDRATDDMFVQRTLGLISARSFAIDALVDNAAGHIDLAFSAIMDKNSAAGPLLEESALATAKAQAVIGELALAAASGIFDTGGGSVTSRSFNFDRHWRNIRTLLCHNPNDYKLKVIGAHSLKGEPPPLSGGFF